MAEARRSPTIDLDVSDDDTYESSTKERVRHHKAFWWDVFLAMQEDKNPHRYRALRADLTKLQHENEPLMSSNEKLLFCISPSLLPRKTSLPNVYSVII